VFLPQWWLTNPSTICAEVDGLPRIDITELETIVGHPSMPPGADTSAILYLRAHVSLRKRLNSVPNALCAQGLPHPLLSSGQIKR